MQQNAGTLNPGKVPIHKGKPTLVGDLLSGSRLGDIVSRARDADTLFKQIKELLPPEVAEHVTGASRREETVLVYADSPAWASRLRFHTPDLLRWLTPRFDGAVERVQVRVMPPAPA